MDTLVKPTFKKPGPDDFFKKLQKEVQEKVLSNKRIQRRIILKNLFFAGPLSHFLCLHPGVRE